MTSLSELAPADVTGRRLPWPRVLMIVARLSLQIFRAISIGAFLASSVLAQQTTLDVEIGQRVKLQNSGGPNVELIINGVDQFDISVTVIDYEHMRFVRTNGNYGYRQPGITTSNSRSPIGDRPGYSIAAVAAFTRCPAWTRA